MVILARASIMIAGGIARDFSETAPEPPAHLGEPEQQIWREVLRDYRGTNAALAVLASGLESHMRARQCREAIAEDGMTVPGRDDQLKPHPLLAVERGAMRAFQQTFKALGIKY